MADASDLHPADIEEAATIFKALADPARLHMLILLSQQDRNVGELADLIGDKIGAVSARLKVLMHARLVTKRRDGKTMIYSIADHHVVSLVENAIEHAREPRRDSD